ncbi:alginate export family protein [Capnocytophaga genosp. AHN8471]|uniref:Alginate export family protein n=1 Tax=Capnocytophaga genosp. AHN8471 TaxID=327574 RepID=A0ABS1YVH8_9FLAO|nr:alginate export family protein [Capnocytophaga genosp. AHN8471]MBM0650252.1 alginate export family protein [Capnocytophaga genosp. AHN8471]MBM0660105.1 alginate export family protein [Capnocytophaga genosp. AHN8471]
MKKHLLSIFALGTAFVLCPTLASAQEELPTPPPMDEMAPPPPPNEFTLSAQLRPRFEYRNGAYRPLVEGESPAILTNNRTRLNFDYKHTDRLHLYISLQNVNVWGQSQQIQAVDRTGGMSVFEAYAEFPLVNTLSAKVGRQMIVLDDDRIFGSLDWHPAGRSHDAVNLNWTPSEKLTLRGFFAYNQSGSTTTPTLNVNTPSGQNFTPGLGQDYQHLQALHAHYSISEAHQLSLLFANLGYRTDDSADQNMQTFGAHYTGKSNQLSYGASAYMQTGKNAGGTEKSAYMFAVNAGYKFSPIFGLTAGVDYLSGNASDDTSGKDKKFNPFSGTNHKFYGFMDYYYVGAPGSKAAPSAGLLNPYLTANVRTGEKSNLSATFHYFAPAAKFEVGGKKHSSYGSEIDLVYNLKVQPFIGLQVGYSTYFANDGTKALKGTANQRGYQDWFWCSLNINPKLFSAMF